MYGKLGTTGLLVMPASAAASGGLGALWWVVAGCTLVAAVLALLRILPRRER